MKHALAALLALGALAAAAHADDNRPDPGHILSAPESRQMFRLLEDSGVTRRTADSDGVRWTSVSAYDVSCREGDCVFVDGGATGQGPRLSVSRPDEMERLLTQAGKRPSLRTGAIRSGLIICTMSNDGSTARDVVQCTVY